jgi:sarcosine oxidase
MGSAAARHLAEAGKDVVLIGPDEPEVCATHTGVFGSHYDSGRIVRVLDPDPVWAALARESVERFAAQQRESGITFFSETGVLFIATDGSRPEGYLRQLERTAGTGRIAVERVEAATAKRVFGWFTFPDGCRAILHPHQAGHLDPRAHLASNQAIIERRGGRVLRETVREILSADAHLVVMTDRQAFTASRVIAATGAYTHALRHPGPSPRLWVETLAVMLVRLDAAQRARYASMPPVICKPVRMEDHVYVLPPIRYPDGKWYLKIGSPHPVAKLTDLTALSRWFREPVPASVEHNLRRLLASYFPELRSAPAEAHPCCTTHTPSGYPYIDAAADPRLVWLVGCNGYAGKSADELGRLAASLAHDGRWSSRVLQRDRFRVTYT